MPENFQQTVDLKEKLAKKDKPVSRTPKKVVKKKTVKRKAEDIDEVYSDNEDVEENKEMHMISRPAGSGNDEGVFKKVAVMLFVVLIAVVMYFMFFQKTEAPTVQPENKNSTGWYSVKLLNDEMYYGQIADTSVDPVVIKNVYYNYDQISGDPSTSSGQETTGNLRLVKRGKETHGPDGTMSVVRAQVVFMEPLKEESKVLKAILDYEK